MKKIIPARVIEKCCTCPWFNSRQPGCWHYDNGIYGGPRPFETSFDYKQFNTTIHPDCPLKDAEENK